MENSIQTNGALQPDPDPRVQELMRHNQDLERRLAEAVQENNRLAKELSKLRDDKETYEGLAVAMLKERYSPEYFEKLDWNALIPAEDVIAEFDVNE